MDSVTHPSSEISRLLDLLPASWRMHTIVAQRPDQAQVITSTPILPWRRDTQIKINFRYWFNLPVNERDLLFLAEVSWRQQTQYFQWGTYQLVSLFALAGTIWETIEGDIPGLAVGVLLIAIAWKQIDRQSKSAKTFLESDNEAIRVAQRRGYTDVVAARSLLEGIQNAAKLEGRQIPSFTELIRCQNLRSLAGISKITVPSEVE
ncbi:MAG: DUF3318 domain-containing protein [Pseudanabaenaceae cyanobacterium SKYGB_i_bin29]|nr:DUF3318 domain-containing protein [Pseudanabaenaceae cyanobacterium SKYG29]MDW8421787.1 DUF3318 domain-containing protein [Pseudanabaenaceae cyanobacterium SKYGB_i_bin29]